MLIFGVGLWLVVLKVLDKMIFLVLVFLIFVYNIKFKIIFLFVCIIEKKIIKKNDKCLLFDGEIEFLVVGVRG